jgi:RNA polymerase sigma factor (sigma-70 family)
VVPTSVSLLERLRAAPAEADWRRLVQLYEPFVRRWLRDPRLHADRDDLVQDVLATLVRELPAFERRREGSFRAWLRAVAVNRYHLWQRQRPHRAGPADGDLAQLADPHSALSRRWDAEHDEHVLRRLFEVLEPEFSAHTWTAFRRLAIDGAPAAAVAAELGTTANAVLLAKSKILRRLREEASGLLD